MKITDRLVGDHKTFRKMLTTINEIKDAPAPSKDIKKLIRMVELFKDHLIIHAWFEDEFYYPAVSQKIDNFSGGPINRQYMAHLENEHKTIDGYVDKLEEEVKKDPIVSTWPQTFALFSLGLSSHMKKEEDELFPESEKVLGERTLIDLSNKIEKHRSEAPKVRSHARC